MQSDEATLVALEKASAAGKISTVGGRVIDFSNPTVKKIIYNRRNVVVGLHKYHTPPDKLPAFPSARKVKGKTPKQKGGGVRKRWIDKDGYIYEWDSQHGAIEKYSRNGKRHIGEFDVLTGEQNKLADSSRKIQR